MYTYISCMGHMITNTMSVLCPHLQLCFYLVFSIHLMASIGSMLSTLVPPILSDHFGFDIEFISYFTLIVLVTSIAGAIVLYVHVCVYLYLCVCICMQSDPFCGVYKSRHYLLVKCFLISKSLTKYSFLELY